MGLFGRSGMSASAVADLLRAGEVEVVGESFHSAAFKTLIGQKGLLADGGTEKFFSGKLVREPRNAHDANAIAVTVLGTKIGHLSREHAATLAPHLDSTGGKAKVRVRVWARYRGDEVFGSGRVLLRTP